MENRTHNFYMTSRISADMDADSDFGCEVGCCIGMFLQDAWGELCEEDCQQNEEAKKNGGMVLGAYNTSRGRIYIITDDAQAETQTTTVLYCDEY